MALKPLSPAIEQDVCAGWSLLVSEAQRGKGGTEGAVGLYHKKKLVDSDVLAFKVKKSRQNLANDFAKIIGCAPEDVERVLLALAEGLEGALREMAVNASGGKEQSDIATAIAMKWEALYAYDLGHEQWMMYGDVKKGVWSPVADTEVERGVRIQMETLSNKGFAAAKLRGVGQLLRTHLYKHFKVANTTWLPCRNGALDTTTMILHPHSPTHEFTWCLPYDYDPTALSPQKTIEFLKETFAGDMAQVQLVRAFFRAILLGRVDLEKYLELIGPGGTGKSTLIRIANALVGRENVFVTELKHLETNRFETSGMVYKRLITITDAEHWNGSVNTLKALVGEDSIRTEEKYKKAGNAAATGLVLIAANEPIQSSDYTSGLERKRITLPFVVKHKGTRQLLSYEGDHFTGEFAEELPGILTWVLGMPDGDMVNYVRKTTDFVPNLRKVWAQSIVETNPLATWAFWALRLQTKGVDCGHSRGDHCTPCGQVGRQAPCIHVECSDEGICGVPERINVGIAEKMNDKEAMDTYRHQDEWLYPNYRGYAESTGSKPVAQNRFTRLLRDLLEHQLKILDIAHYDGNRGSQFSGIRLVSRYERSMIDNTPATAHDSPAKEKLLFSVEDDG
jgi:putative DNA primase/helicase